MTPHMRAAELDTTDIEDWGQLKLHGPTLYETADGSVTTGTWQCGPGESQWDFTDDAEFIHVLSGSMTASRTTAR